MPNKPHAHTFRFMIWDEDPRVGENGARWIVVLVGIVTVGFVVLAVWDKDVIPLLIWLAVLAAILLAQVFMALVAWTVAHLWYRIRDFRKPPPGVGAKRSETDQPS